MSVDLSQAWAGILVKRIDNGYTLSNFEANAAVLKTNLVSNTAYRGNKNTQRIVWFKVYISIFNTPLMESQIIKEMEVYIGL